MLRTSSIRRATAEATVAALLEARAKGTQLASSWDAAEHTPKCIDEAYATQALWQQQAKGCGKPIGYKIGASNAAARTGLKLEVPFWGRLYSDLVVPSGGSVAASDYLVRAVEPEIVLELGEDVTTGGKELNADDVKAITASVFPALEVVSSAHGTEWKARGGLNLIADNGAHGFMVLPKQRFTVADVAGAGKDETDIPAELFVNGELKHGGSSKNVDGGPFAVTAWLLNQLRQAGTVEKGTLISTGTMTTPWMGNAGDSIEAKFGSGLGSVELSWK